MCDQKFDTKDQFFKNKYKILNFNMLLKKLAKLTWNTNGLKKIECVCSLGSSNFTFIITWCKYFIMDNQFLKN